MRSKTSPRVTEDFVAPYRRSLLEMLLGAIARLPGPTWLWYAGASVVFFIVGTSLNLMDGTLKLDAESFLYVFNHAYVLYPLYVMAYLNHVARRSLARFRPALGDLAPDYQVLEYRLTTMRPGLLFLGVGNGLFYTVSGVISGPATFGFIDGISFATVIYLVIEGLIIGLLFGVLIVFALRQLAFVVRLHRISTAISLYERRTHSAFSLLTVRTSVMIAFPIYIVVLFLLLTGSVDVSKLTLADLIVVPVLLLGAIGLFIIPLWGMHRRLTDLRSRAGEVVEQRIEAAMRHVGAGADAGLLNEQNELGSLLSNLVIERETIRKKSTWPWETETIRGFASSILLPVVIWGATTLLGRLFQ